MFVVCELQCWWSNWMSCLRKKRERKKGKKRETQLLLDSECRDYCISIDSCSAALFCMNSRQRRLNVQQTHHFRRHDAYWAGSECHAAYYFQRQYAVCIMGAECKFYYYIWQNVQYATAHAHTEYCIPQCNALHLLNMCLTHFIWLPQVIFLHKIGLKVQTIFISEMELNAT